ncbi:MULTISPECIES: DNA sulfur modification protein DndB [unclassified Shewanella]|uniref:DNA sulfur modification protein DndB n=1 Tax=unclassified Shewanella TaxID=196818 RepID=UPI001BBF10F1|nr:MULTISPECIES: DNA sulfur modification protein DndB [unclassified Shewanella]GIU10815.1 hypothetical protein TUM4444_15700 [Shewanella sp. MBTL60-112-B1]GIU32945.1 hypothetical protein TUM4445_19300 [Shewanella sp. MBTL60-112-B2]
MLILEKQLLSSEIEVLGLSADQKYGNGKSILCLIPSTEVQNYFSPFESLPEDLELIFSELLNSTNQNRIKRLEEEIVHGLCSEQFSTPLSLTIAVSDESLFSKRKAPLDLIRYKPQRAFLVDGILTYCAIMNLLGYELKFPNFVVNQKQKGVDPRVRQMLAGHYLHLTIIFDEKNNLEQSDILRLCKIFNQREVQLHSVNLARITSDSPIKELIYQLEKELRLDKFGGMSSKATRVTKSDPFITTESTMLHMILAAIGGSRLRMSTKTINQLSDGSTIDRPRLERIKPAIIIFFSAWLESCQKQLKYNRDGFHYSTQIWQALGLVIHDLIDNQYSLDNLKRAGSLLGQLDYSRDAKHWQYCSAMMIDIRGYHYKNATSGGRTFREGIARYFIEVVS